MEDTPILQQFYASKYVGVATLTFDEGGSLTSSTGESVPLGVSFDEAGISMMGVHCPPTAMYSIYLLPQMSSAKI